MRTVVLVLSLVSFASLSAQPLFNTLYKPGDYLYVFTASGLTLRDRPQIEGAALKVLPYGTEVMVQPNPVVVTIMNSGIQGAWARVKAGDQSGYVFDGFLSRMAPVKIHPDPSALELSDYLKKRFTVSTENTEPPDSTISHYLFVEFQNHVTVENIAAPGGADVSTSFPDTMFTFKEIYLLAKVLYPDFFKEGGCFYNEGTLDCQSGDYNQLFIRSYDQRFTIKRRHLD